MVLGIIPDGNRRWAKAHGLSAHAGHTAGMNSLSEVIKYFLPKVEHLYVYLLAWHNWERNIDELVRLTEIEALLIQKYKDNPKITLQHGHPPRNIGKSMDVIVRSKEGNSELSGFFPEESQTARVIVLNKFWPDVTPEDINEAIRQ